MEPRGFETLKIVAPRAALRQFRAECRRKYPKEHVGALFGHRAPDGSVMITRIAPVPHTSTNGHVDYDTGALQKSKTTAIKDGEEWLGTIHSHCYVASNPTCWHLSETDINSAIMDGETICGLVYVYARGRRSDVSWYIPQPLPEVGYY